MTDYGPSIEHRPSGLVSRGPGRVTLEYREDLDATPDKAGNRPVVSGARRRNALRGLMLDGALTKRQHDAADRFLDDLCRAQGGSSASFLSIYTGGGGSREGVTAMQSRALNAIQRVRLMLGLTPDTVTWWVVLDNKTPAEFDREHRLRHGTGVKWLRAALDALDGHYNPSAHGMVDTRG